VVTMECTFFQRSKVACAAVLMLAASQAPVAQQRETADVSGMAHALVRAFYPTLLRQQLYFAIIGSDGVPLDGLVTPLMHFAIAVIKPADPQHPDSRRSEILSGFIDFDVNGQLTGWLTRDGDFTNDDRRRRLRAQLGQNMSDAQVDAILSEAGVRHGLESEKEFLEMVRSLLSRLEPFIGKATILSSEFQPRNQSLVWGVEVRAQRNQSVFEYKFSFEAIDGKLIGIHRH
jgi:hypothetical protein